jgi:hypothetical protein
MKITNIYVVAQKDSIEPLGVFTKRSVAEDFWKHEHDNCEIQIRAAVVRDRGVAYLLDPRISHGLEIGDDYKSEPTQKLNEHRASALAKLTLEEKLALGW